jgi:hypothetical protein
MDCECKDMVAYVYKTMSDLIQCLHWFLLPVKTPPMEVELVNMDLPSYHTMVRDRCSSGVAKKKGGGLFALDDTSRFMMIR